jgi:hypothetical protein
MTNRFGIAAVIFFVEAAAAAWAQEPRGNATCLLSAPCTQATIAGEC